MRKPRYFSKVSLLLMPRRKDQEEIILALQFEEKTTLDLIGLIFFPEGMQNALRVELMVRQTFGVALEKRVR